MGSATIIIANFTPVSLRLTDSHRDWGDWGVRPPDVIDPGGRVNFRGETDWAGTSGYVAYQSGTSVDPTVAVIREERRMVIRWSRPVVGDNSLTASIPEWHGGGSSDAPLTLDVREIMEGSDPTWVVNVLVNPDYSAATARPGGFSPSYHGPTCVSWDPSRLDLFDAAQDASLLHRWYSDSGGWSAWESIVQPQPRAADRGRAPRWWATSWGPGRLDAFGVANQGHLEHVWFQGGNDGPGWGQWDDLGGDGLSQYLAVASSRPGRIDVIGVHTDGSLRHISHDKGSWTPWVNLGGLGTPGPNPLMLAAASPGPGRVDLFTVDAAGAVHRARFTDEPPTWTSWEPLALTSPAPLEVNSGSLAATFDGSGMRLFALALGGNLLQARESPIRLAGHDPAWLDWTYLTTVDHGASACTRGSTVHVLATANDQVVNTYINVPAPLGGGDEAVGTEVLSP